MRQPLYQVHVEVKGGKILPIGPAMLKGAADNLAQTIKTEIAKGTEKTWFNPQVLPVISTEH